MRSHAAWIGLLGLLVVILFREIALGDAVLYQRDIQLVWYGQAETFARCIRAGSWPLWDPSMAFGRPFLANPSTQVFYPWTWTCLLLSPEAAYSLYVVSHLVLTAVGLYALALHLGQSRLAAATAAAVWSLSGPLLSLASLWHHFAGACWMPWVLLAAERSAAAPGLRRFLALGLVFAVQVLAASADMCMLTALLILAVAATRVRWRSSWRQALRPLAGVALGCALASGLTAMLWLPALEVLTRSPRFGLAEGIRTFWSVHPASLLQVVLPLLPGALPLNAAWKGSLYESREPFLDSLYLGVVALALAASALLRPARPRVRLYALLGLLALLVSLGKHAPAYAAVVSILPPLRVIRYPSKAMAVVALAVAVLAGFGLDRWRASLSARGSRALAALAAFLAAAAALAAAASRWAADALGRSLLDPAAAPDGFAPLLEPTGLRLWVAAALAGGAALLMARARGGGGSSAWLASLAALATLDLFAAHRGLSPTVPAGTLSRPPAVLRLLTGAEPPRIFVFDYEFVVLGRAYRRRTDLKEVVVHPVSPLPPDVARVLSLQEYLLQTTSKRWGLYGSYDLDLLELYPRPLARAVLFLRGVEETPAFRRLLQVGGVGHVLALHDEGLEGLHRVAEVPSMFREPIRVFRVPRSLPYAYAVGGARVARGLDALRLIAGDAFDPEREVVLSSGAATPPREDFTGRVVGVVSKPDRIRLDVDLSHEGFVVVLDGDDPGWRASIDGRRAPVLTANELFRAVRCPAGRHRVEFVYRPASLVAGLTVAALTALLAVALARRAGKRP